VITKTKDEKPLEKSGKKLHAPLDIRQPYQRLSSGTGGAAESMNEAGDVQITVGFDTTTSAPPVVQQRLVGQSRYAERKRGSWTG
jgi:hypothetical protein